MTVLIFGVPEASWIASLGVMLRIVNHDGKYIHALNTPVYKTLFNGANIVLSSGFAGICYEALGGIPGQLELTNVIPMIASIVIYIIVNAIIMSMLMTILSGDNLAKLLYTNIIWVIRTICISSLIIIMALAYINYGILGVLLFGPLLLARYSFKLYVDMKICILILLKLYVEQLKLKILILEDTLRE